MRRIYRILHRCMVNLTILSLQDQFQPDAKTFKGLWLARDWPVLHAPATTQQMISAYSSPSILGKHERLALPLCVLTVVHPTPPQVQRKGQTRHSSAQGEAWQMKEKERGSSSLTAVRSPPPNVPKASFVRSFNHNTRLHAFKMRTLKSRACLLYKDCSWVNETWSPLGFSRLPYTQRFYLDFF